MGRRNGTNGLLGGSPLVGIGDLFGKSRGRGWRRRPWCGANRHREFWKRHFLRFAVHRDECFIELNHVRASQGQRVLHSGW